MLINRFLWCFLHACGDVSFEGYATIGNKVVKISVSPRPATNNRGEDGYYVTVVATTFQPRNNGTVGSNRGAKF